MALDYDDFKEALIRICIKSKDILGKINDNDQGKRIYNSINKESKTEVETCNKNELVSFSN
jgi:hypothetical protein